MKFKTSTGFEIELLPVPELLVAGLATRLRKQLITEGLPLDPPTYKIVDPELGINEEWPHTKETLDDPSDPEQTTKNYDAWEKHKAALNTYNQKYIEQLSRLLMYNGVQIDENDYKKGTWAKEQSLWLDVPTEEPDRKIHYVSTVLLKTQSDIFEVVVRLLGMSRDGSVNEEAVSAAVDAFRHSVRLTREQSAANSSADQVEQVATQPDSDRDRSS